MEVTDQYYRTKISHIPKESLRDIIQAELQFLLHDYNQSITQEDFGHLKFRVFKQLTEMYPHWSLSAFDNCLRAGKLNYFDKSTKITVQRLELWFYSHDVKMKADYHKPEEADQTVYHYPDEYYIANATRYVPVISFRIARKPEFDDDIWTLDKIEQTDDFKKWKRIYHGAGNISELTKTLTK